MKNRWLVALAAALLCLGVSLSAGWLWRTMSDPNYEACSRLVCGVSSGDRGATNESEDDEPDEIDEAHVLSPEVMSAAAALLQERGVPLSLPSPFDPVTDYLLHHSRVSRPADARPGEICIHCTAVESDEALQILKAVVDAWLSVEGVMPADGAEPKSDEAQAEIQVEREQLTQAIDRQKQTISELAGRLELTQADAAQSDEEAPLALEGEMGRVRQAHREAAARLADARRDIDNRIPAETVAARIADLPSRTRVLERLNLAKVREQRDRQEMLLRKWSSVYGRNHPRMVEIREKIDALDEQIAALGAEESGEASGHPAASPSSIVLAAFESESSSLEQTEQNLAERLSDVQTQSQGRQDLELQLGEARQELGFLNAESDRVQKQISAAEREQSGQQPSVVSPPAIDREPMGAQSGLPMAVSCVLGMSLYLLLLWQIRTRWLASDREPAAGERGTAAPRPQRFRSKEEEQLMRLKLAARG